MREIELLYSMSVDLSTIVSAATKLHLTVSMECELKKWPGSRHWHLRKSGHSGTLEVTYWSHGERFWINYHQNRLGDGWVERAANELASLLSQS